MGKILKNFFRKNNRRTVVANNQGTVVTSNVYGQIHMPIYNKYFPITSGTPEIYNKKGERMDMFFIRDFHSAHNPYCLPNPPTRFLWDRFNIALDTHFYSHDAMLETMGNPRHKYGMLIESRAIVPNDYKIFDKNPGLYKDFDAIFTYDFDILNIVPNAKFLPFCAQTWYGDKGNGIVNPNAYKYKTKNVSIVSSDKLYCEMHKYRIELARKCRDEGLADTFGTFDGGQPVQIANTLTDYRYSICIENDINPYFFTEKITNCFMSMTVPIYCGATEISKFFNPDGIISINCCVGGGGKTFPKY